MSQDIDLLAAARRGPVHFMGIAGAGMSTLAAFLAHAGGTVTGCDRRLGPGVRKLEARGVRLWEGHDPVHVEGCEALVVTAAVPADHPEIRAARDLGMPVLKRAAALAAVCRRGQVVAVGGTHGKTTTSALTAAVLSAAGLDPTGLVGARVPGWEGGFLPGGERLFVVEADEFDRSFHALHPNVAVVTALEADHLDTYGSLEALEEAFRTFADRVPDGGLLAACGDDSGVGRLLPRLRSGGDRVLTYGTNAGSMLRAEDVRSSPDGSRFRVRERGRGAGELTVRMPGLHNVRNALAAAAVARHLGADWPDIRRGLASLEGIDRRFERVGEAGGVVVVNDYAHHPTELAAMMEAARGAYPERRLVAVFQPHLYSRTRDFADAFGRALAPADLLILTDVYPAREEPIPGVDGELVARAARAHGAAIRYVSERADVTAAVMDVLRPGDLCLTLGAGDLDEAAREMVAALGGEVRP